MLPLQGSFNRTVYVEEYNFDEHTWEKMENWIRIVFQTSISEKLEILLEIKSK